jgi:hypothetical protein
MECSQIQSTLFDQLSGKLVDCAFISQFEYDSEQYYAALMDDGSLWRWHYLTGFTPITTGISNGLLAGLVIGVVFIAGRWIMQSNPQDGGNIT